MGKWLSQLTVEVWPFHTADAKFFLTVNAFLRLTVRIYQFLRLTANFFLPFYGKNTFHVLRFAKYVFFH